MLKATTIPNQDLSNKVLVREKIGKMMGPLIIQVGNEALSLVDDIS